MSSDEKHAAPHITERYEVWAAGRLESAIDYRIEQCDTLVTASATAMQIRDQFDEIGWGPRVYVQRVTTERVDVVGPWDTCRDAGDA